MDFRIADTFTSSLSRLTAEEQKAAKTTAFDLQVNPAHPGLSFHRLDRARDRNFWSVRVSGDIRLIVHKTSKDMLLCYVDHHDKAYAWAERRKLETHPKTGAAQMVVITEIQQEVRIPVYAESQPAGKGPLFDGLSDDELLGFGVPPESLTAVRNSDEATILDLAAELPAEASEALLVLATGGTPSPRPVADTEPFEHPDAQRRFRVIKDIEELERALEYPWEKWTVFLHPAQRDLVDRNFNGPARAAGSAGTGKTVVAIHRAVSLARKHPEARILLTTFSDPLANALRIKLGRLAGTEPRLRERIDVDSLDIAATRLYEKIFGKPELVDGPILGEAIAKAAERAPDVKSSHGFLVSEWHEIVDAWQIRTWDDYRDVARLGRKTRLAEKQREGLWKIFDDVRSSLDGRGLITMPAVYARLAEHYRNRAASPYDFIVVDESQDVSVPQLKFISALGASRPNGLFFAGDLGQRIFQLPFSWKSLGVDVRGRSSTLRVNYRTSHQIRAQADRLLGAQLSDIDGNVDTRAGTVSVFNGPQPEVRSSGSEAEEIDGVARWISARRDEGVVADEIAVFVRSEGQIRRAVSAVKEAGLDAAVLRADVRGSRDHVSVGTMHLSKGLEFRAVAVMACDDEVLPLQERIESVTDDSDLDEVYETERHLLYVACTRARDYLMVSGVIPTSEFLSDLDAADP